MKKELNLQGDKYTAYSPDNINWVVVAEEDVIPEFDIISYNRELSFINNNIDIISDNREFNYYLTTIARDGIVESIKALKLQIAKPTATHYTYTKDLYIKNIPFHPAYICNYFDNDYYVRVKVDKSKRRFAYYFYKNKDDVAKLLKFNNIKWLSEEFYE